MDIGIDDGCRLLRCFTSLRQQGHRQRLVGRIGALAQAGVDDGVDVALKSPPFEQQAKNCRLRVRGNGGGAF